MPAEHPSGDTDDEEGVQQHRHATSDDGFVWDTAVPPALDTDVEPAVTTSVTEEVVATKPGADGFEWCVEGGGSTVTDVETTLDPELVSERRVDRIDDEAVHRLAELRQDPTVGRWRRATSELDDEE